jgi:hypothetical protein
MWYAAVLRFRVVLEGLKWWVLVGLWAGVESACCEQIKVDHKPPGANIKAKDPSEAIAAP